MTKEATLEKAENLKRQDQVNFIKAALQVNVSLLRFSFFAPLVEWKDRISFPSAFVSVIST